MIYLENNVFDEALERIRYIYDEFDDVIVSMSGGKDSTVVFHLALMVAKERGRLPLKVFWLDQEAEWQSTVDYMDSIMRLPEVKPYWFQVPFDFTNSLSPQKNFIHLWAPEDEALWIHPHSDIAITECKSKDKRFHQLIKSLQSECTDSDNAIALCGMKVSESMMRRMALTTGKSRYKGLMWISKKQKGVVQTGYPIYDWNDSDIWTAIGRNHWAYNVLYDKMYQFGVSPQRMRCSALIHETAWHSIEQLQEFEPETYNRFCKRVPGTDTFAHAFETEVIPKKLPFMFRDWKEYRDYLLIHLVKPEYHELFRKRWQGQDTVEWYKVHVRECIVNDIDGTINTDLKLATRKGGGSVDKRPTHKFSAVDSHIQSLRK